MKANNRNERDKVFAIKFISFEPYLTIGFNV